MGAPTISGPARTHAPDGSLPHRVATATVDALIAEATLTPKPGLVDLDGPGSHRDMDVITLVRSAEALHDTFRSLAELGAEAPAIDADLRARSAAIGRDGERAMLEATRGVNTHRGAIWALGLTVVAVAHPSTTCGRGVHEFVAELARFDDPDTPRLRRTRNGERARRRYGVGGAVGAARAGFPVARAARRELARRRAYGAGPDHALLDALLVSMSTLDDTCVLHRGGPAALALVRDGAAHVLGAGGAEAPRASALLRRFDSTLCARKISPGGSGDMLALAIFLESVLPDVADPRPERSRREDR
jgi:triphosphoribosyl-dephospho-CoA synthase